MKYTGANPAWVQADAIDWNFLKRYRDGYHLWVPQYLPSPHDEEPGHDVWTHVPEEGNAQLRGYYALESNWGALEAQVLRGMDAQIVIVDPGLNEREESRTPGPGAVATLGADYGTADADSNGELDGLPLYTYQDSDPAGTWRGIFMADDNGGVHSPKWRTHTPVRMLMANQTGSRPPSANFGGNGSVLGSYKEWAAKAIAAGRAAQASRGWGVWKDSQGSIPADDVGTNADHVRRAMSEVSIFHFYGHGTAYASNPSNDGNAIVTRHMGIGRDGALATTAAAAEALSDDYVAYGLIDGPDRTASSYSGTWLTCIFACNSYAKPASIAAYLKNQIGVTHAVGFNRTMHAKLGYWYDKAFWEEFNNHHWFGASYVSGQLRTCAQIALTDFWNEVNTHSLTQGSYEFLVSDGLDQDDNPVFVVADNYAIDTGEMRDKSHLYQ